MIGRTLSHHKVLDEISRGGMGIVYKALDLKLNREVALKVLPPELVSDPDRKRRFVQEAQAAAALKHPNIGVIYEVDEVDGVDFIAMELIEGEMLSDLLNRGPLPPERAIDIGIEMADGLADAHDRGIVHRDLKPGNVMITKNGHPKIIDFGLAKLMEGLSVDSEAPTTPKGETQPGQVMGTYAYMSPEQARGEKLDHRSDIFSFGVLLYEMLAEDPPFKRATTADTFSAILRDPTPRLTGLGEATEALPRIVERCLEKAPADRYPSMREAQSDLESMRSNRRGVPRTS